MMMATTNHPSNIFHPSPVYSKGFFAIRLSITVNSHPTTVDDSLHPPTLRSSCPGLVMSVSLCDMAQEMSTLLAAHQISLCHVYYDEHCPLYAIDFPPPVTAHSVNALLPLLADVCGALSDKYFSTLPGSSVEYMLYLCSPSNDEYSASRVTAINSSNVSQVVMTYLKGEAIRFSELFSEHMNDKPNPTFKCLIDMLLEASPKWFFLGCLLGAPADKLLVFEEEYNRNPHKCLVFMIKWLVDNRTVTWRKVVRALCKIRMRNLARDVCKKQNVPFPEEEGKETEMRTQIAETAAEVSLPEHEEEDKMREEVEALEEEMKESVQETHDNVEHIINVEYPKLKEELEELKEQKLRIEKRLDLEKQECAVLHKTKEHYNTEINDLEIKLRKVKKELQGRIDYLSSKIQAIERDIAKKESFMVELTEKLETTDKKYLEKSEQMANLAKLLSSKTAELVKKSSVLMALQNSLLDSDRSLALEAETQRKMDQKYLNDARKDSQAAYVTEIENQISAEREMVTHLEDETKLAAQECSTLEAEVAVVEHRLQTREQCQTDTGDPDALVEAQVELTSLKIDVINHQLDLAQARIREHRSHANLHHHQLALNFKENLLPDLSKTQVVGVTLPKHKMDTYTDMEFYIHLFDKDGDPCGGEHEVTVDVTIENRSIALLAVLDEFEQGVYGITYPLMEPGEYLLSTSVNHTDLPDTCSFTIICTTRPDAQCSLIKVQDRLAVSAVARVKVVPADKKGLAIAQDQTVTVSLQFKNSNHFPTLVSSESIKHGEYTVYLLPRCAGLAVLQVYINGEPFANPMTVTVEDQPDTKHTALTGAAEAGCVDFIVQLLAVGFNVNEQDGTPLGVAAERGHTRAVETLVENGANVNIPGWLNQTPLMLAAKGGHFATVETLLKRGANVNSKDILSQTPLMLAAKRGDWISVGALIDHRANVNAKDEAQQTALMMAAEGGHYSIVKRLIGAGADARARNKDSETAFDLAVKGNFDEMADFINEWTTVKFATGTV